MRWRSASALSASCFMIVSMNDKLAEKNRAAADQAATRHAFEAESRPTGGAIPNIELKAWHEVLGVASNASTEDIRAAYRKKISQYRPDKVSSFGPEFTVMAERMTKDINDAYEQALRHRGEQEL